MSTIRDSIRLILEQSQYFGLVLSIGAYLFACWLKKRTGLAILNPLLVSAALIIACIFGVGMDYETYNKGASYLSWLLTPATVCLAIPLYKQLHLLKQHGDAVVLGITSGVATSAVSVFLLCRVLGLTHTHYVTLLPKSITTAIGMGVSQEAGGIVTLTVMSIVLTGVKGAGPWNQRPCGGDSQGPGTGRNRRRHEQPFHCSGRSDDRDCGAAGGESYKIIMEDYVWKVM